MVPFSWPFYSQKIHLLTLLGLFINQNDRFPYPFIYFETMWNHYPFIYLNPEKRVHSYWVEPSCIGGTLPPLGLYLWAEPTPIMIYCFVQCPHRSFINFCRENDMPAKICLSLIKLHVPLALWGCIMFNLNFFLNFFLLSFFFPPFLFPLFL